MLRNRIESASADFITSTFGLKTFSEEQHAVLAREISRILKKGGQVSMIEVSKPLRILFMFYLKRVIPLIGKLFMGNSRDYRMLGIYCEAFGDCRSFRDKLEKAGIQTGYKEYFFGCATGVVGVKL